MKYYGDNEENTSLADRALWWIKYQDHVITEIRQLRGRMNAATKTGVI